ncbi:MAG: FAD/FMN-containing dehydrogenase, partial [Flavobacteriales bacterium]
MTARARYATALRRSRLVIEEYHPETLVALAEVLAERAPTIVIGAGRDGSARPDAPSAIVHTDALPKRITLDAHSGLAQVSAWSTWAELEREVSGAGWTISHLQDADPDASVGGTLARAALLPALWMSQTSAAACVGAEALSGTGERYSYPDAPRTSSGPDWRTLWFGSEGRGGALTRISIELARAMPITAHRIAARRISSRRLRLLLEPFLNIAQLAPASADAWRVRVRGDSHRASLARQHLSAAGFAQVPAEAAVWPEKALLVA